MSIVAYRDGVLACDGRITMGDIIVSDEYTKISKIKGAVGGFVGDAEAGAELVRWFEDGADLKKIPKNKGSGIVVYEKPDRIFMIEEGGYFEVSFDHYYARGSGKEVAMGAFWMGASAEDAVNASIAHISTTGGTVFVEKL